MPSDRDPDVVGPGDDRDVAVAHDADRRPARASPSTIRRAGRCRRGCWRRGVGPSSRRSPRSWPPAARAIERRSRVDRRAWSTGSAPSRRARSGSRSTDRPSRCPPAVRCSTRCASTSASRRRRTAAARRASAGAARCGSTASPASRASRRSVASPVGPSRRSRASRAPTAGPSAFCANGGSQCGFCTPGIIMRVAALTDPTEAAVRQALLAHLCRCTGWHPIVNSVLSASDGALAAFEADSSGGDGGRGWRAGWRRTWGRTSRSGAAGSPTTPRRPVRSSPCSTPTASGWSASRWPRRAS